MKTLTRLLLCAALLATAMLARAERIYNQAELDALLAPIALYPDQVLSNILVAASYPDEVKEAAGWTRDNAQLHGDDALRAIQPAPWQPAVKALVPFPEVLARMAESPDWLRDLGEAYRTHGPYVMDTVQALRRRAQANGGLQSNPQQQVYGDGGAIVVAPASPEVVYVPYYDPYVVYGGWWWPAYRPVVWAPWPTFGAFISVGFVATRFDWGHRNLVVVNHPVFVNRPVFVNHPGGVNRPGTFNHPVTRTQFRSGPATQRFNGPPAPSVRMQQQASRQYVNRMAAANRMPPAQGFHGQPMQSHGPAQSHSGFQGHQSMQGHWGGGHGGRRG
jgi:hypothetical protein